MCQNATLLKITNCCSYIIMLAENSYVHQFNSLRAGNFGWNFGVGIIFFVLNNQNLKKIRVKKFWLHTRPCVRYIGLFPLHYESNPAPFFK